MTRSPVFITETARYILRHVHPDLKRALRRALDEMNWRIIRQKASQ